MSYIGTTEIGKMFLGDVEIDKAYLGNDLVFQNGPTPLPYTPLTYLQTDGTAYINSGVAAASPRSAELKVMLPSNTGCCFCGRGEVQNSGTSAGKLSPLIVLSNLAGYAYRARFVTNTPSVATSITNQTPFEVRTKLANGSQQIDVKQQGESSWTTTTSTQGSSVTGTTTFYIFATNNSGAKWKTPNGSRIYYIKIYSDADFGTLLFDGVPCIYNGNYGLWNKVNSTFYGNAGSTGAFSGQ